jgi:hypothetical protein
MKTNRATQARRSPFEARVGFAQVVTGIGAVGFGTLAVGAVAIGASAIRKLAIRRGQNRAPRNRPAERSGSGRRAGANPAERRAARFGRQAGGASRAKPNAPGVKEVEQGRQKALYEKTA